MNIPYKRILCVLAAALGAAQAAPTPATPFTDNAVLQRDCAVPVWGTAEAGETVRVSFGGQSKTAVADADGNWCAVLDPMPARVAGELIIEGNGATRTLSNVITGEVWFSGGQSNATLPLNRADPDAAAEIAQADYPEIRELRSGIVASETPQTVGRGAWRVCTPKTAGDFSGMGYFFAKKIARDLNVPVGILNCNKGGAPIFSMMRREAFEQSTHAARVQASVDAASARWAARQKGAAMHKEPGEDPMNPFGKHGFSRRAVLFNGMVRPLVPFAMRGVLWNQGEADMALGSCYADLMETLVADWRDAWKRPDLPFLVVQLANISDKGSYEPSGRAWPIMREAQSRTREIGNAYVCVSCDIGSLSDTPNTARHPANKRELGRRLALLALAHVYGKDIPADAAFFKDAAVKGGKIVCAFENAQGLKTRDGDAPGGFEIAGEDGHFAPAQARIVGENIEIFSPEVAQPKIARYAWNNTCAGANVVNGAGLPLAPFRTATW